ncbi:hypothetical protein Hanom_Chr01g00039841 [Helianthus anomalus]
MVNSDGGGDGTTVGPTGCYGSSDGQMVQLRVSFGRTSSGQQKSSRVRLSFGSSSFVTGSGLHMGLTLTHLMVRLVSVLARVGS